MVGCKSFCGLLDPADVADATAAGVNDEEGATIVPRGQSLAEALEQAGLAATPRVEMEPGRYLGYFASPQNPLSRLVHRIAALWRLRHL